MLFTILYVGIWLAITSPIYWFLLHKFIRTRRLAPRIAFAFLCSIFLGPGLFGGHGFVPFPGGLAWIGLLLDAKYASDNFAVNLACWAVTLIVFLVLNAEANIRHQAPYAQKLPTFGFRWSTALLLLALVLNPSAWLLDRLGGDSDVLVGFTPMVVAATLVVSSALGLSRVSLKQPSTQFWLEAVGCVLLAMFLPEF